MTLLSADQSAALASAGPHPWLCTLDFPSDAFGGTTPWYVSNVGYIERGYAEKQYRPIVRQFTPPRYTVSDSGGNVPGVEMAITVWDEDGTLAQLTEGPLSDYIEGSAVSVRQASPSLDQEDFVDIFVGVVVNVSWKDRLCTIRCRLDDDALKDDAPQTYARFTVESFPVANPDIWTKTASVIYGEYDSSGFTDAGFIPLRFADRTDGTWMYVASIGRLMDVSAVFLDDTRLTETTHYTWGYLARRGVWYTVVYLTEDAYEDVYDTAWSGGSPADQLRLATGARVNADVLGYETTGFGAAGGGQLITNPIDQLIHFLTNFVFGSWRRGAWLATDARLADYATIQEFFEDRNYQGSMFIGDVAPASRFVSQWLTSFEAVAWWGRAGRLNFAIDNFAEDVDFSIVPYASQEKLDLVKHDDRQRVGATVVKFVRDAAGGTYLSSVSAKDATARVQSPDTLEQVWGASK